MEFHGRIIELLEPRGGFSSKTGEEWKEQSFVVENDGRYPVRILFSMFGTDKIVKFSNCLKLNAFVNVSFDIAASNKSGRWFNDVQAYKLELTPKQPFLNQQPTQGQLTAKEQEVLDNANENDEDPF